MNFIAIAVISVAVIASVECFPGGAPVGSCDSLFPEGHGVDAQSSPFPYLVQSTYEATTGLVLLEVVSLATDIPIRGLQIQVRNQLNERRGTLEIIGNDSEYQILDCPDEGAITHTSNTDKGFAVFDWVPPVDRRPEEVFQVRITVVQSFTIFWVDQQFDIELPILEVTNPSTAAVTTPTTTTSAPAATTPTTPAATTATTAAAAATTPTTAAAATTPTTPAATAVAGTTTRTGQQRSCESGGNVYTPTADCSGFVQSIKAEPERSYLMNCPSPTVFSLTSCVCDHFEMANCPGKIRRT